MPASDDSTSPGAHRRSPLSDASNAPPTVKPPPRGKKPTPAQRAAAAEKELADTRNKNAALEEQLAISERKRRDAEAKAAKTSSSSDGEKIPRPRGKFNLQHAMGLDDDKGFYNYLMTETRHIVMQKLDRRRQFQRQDDVAMARFSKEVTKTKSLEYLQRFEGNWVAKEFAKQSLKSFRAHGGSRRARSSRRSGSHSGSDDDDVPGSAAEDG